MSLCLRLLFCRESKALAGKHGAGEKPNRNLFTVESGGLSCCLLPLTSRRMRRGTAGFEPCISPGVRPAQ